MGLGISPIIKTSGSFQKISRKRTYLFGGANCEVLEADLSRASEEDFSGGLGDFLFADDVIALLD